MNIQDIGIDINALENKKELYYKLELAKPNQEIIGVIVNSYGNNAEFNFNGIHELNFTIPYTVNGNQNIIKVEKRYDEILKEIDNLSENISSTFTPHTSIESQQIKELMYVKLSYFDKHEWFVIDSINDSISDDDEMEVNCFSLPYELKRKKIFSEIDLGTVTIREVLENTLLLDTGWKLGSVATEFSELYRNIKISNGDKYNSIIEVAESFGAVLDWNSDNKTINILFLENTLKNKGLIINSENLLNSLSRERTTENILTRMYIYGNENMSVENVNPTGQRYIEDFSYFVEPFERDSGKNILKHSYYMSDALCHALLDIKELSNQILPQIKSKQTDITNKLSSLSEIMIEVIEAENKVGILKGLLDVAKATGDASLTSQRQSELDLAESQLNVLMSQQSSLEGQIEALNVEIASMQKQIDTTSFTEELKNELAPFIIEGEFKDDRYIDETELYNDAVKEFIKNRDPKQVLKVDLTTVLNDPENIYYRDKINLGDLATVRYPNANIDFQEPIVSISIDFDEFDIKLDISEHDDDLEPLDRLVSLIYDTSSSMATLEGNKYKWDTIINIKNIVDEMRDGVIDATRNRIIAGVNESVNIGSDGIILTNPDFPNDMIIMQSGVIALSQDGGKNWDTSVTAKGIMADTIIGRLLVGNELIISNDSGSFVIDSNGLTVDINSIKIMSGESGTPEDMIQKWNSVLSTVADMTNDGVLNEYEKNQLEKQFLAEKTAYSEMIKAYKESMGPETPENQYSLEFDNLVKAYEDMNTLLNVTLQSDGFAILDINNRTKTTTVDPNIFNSIINGFTTAKEVFLVKTPMDFTATAIEQTKNYISLNYVKNGEVVNEINLSEDGVKIDGSKVEISGDTTFKDDLIMSSGKITSSDGTSFVIDMNNNRIDLGETLYINGNVVLTSGDVANDVVKTTKVYGESMSPLTQPTVWTETPPAWKDGYYIWELSTEHLRNGTTRELEPVNITGAKGPKGQDGANGANFTWNMIRGTSDDCNIVNLTNAVYYTQFFYPDVIWEVGQSYTFSLLIERLSDDNSPINVHVGSGATAYQLDIIEAQINGVDTTKRVVINFTIEEKHLAKGDKFAFRVRNERVPMELCIKEVKLEKGINANPTWSPHETEIIDNSFSWNLLKNGHLDYSLEPWLIARYPFIINRDDAETQKIDNTILKYFSNTLNINQRIERRFPPLTKGTYTYSLRVRISNTELKYGTWKTPAYAEYQEKSENILVGEWQTISLVFNAPDQTQSQNTVRFYLPNLEVGASVEFDWEKLELGTNLNPTWSPHESEIKGEEGVGIKHIEPLYAYSTTPTPDFKANEKAYNSIDLFDKTKLVNLPMHPVNTTLPLLELTLAPNTQYTLSTNIPKAVDGVQFDLFFDLCDMVVSSTRNGVAINAPGTLTSDETGKVWITFRSQAFVDKVIYGEYWVKLEEGSEATPRVEDIGQEILWTSYGVGKNLVKRVTKLSDISTSHLGYSIKDDVIVQEITDSTLNGVPIHMNIILGGNLGGKKYTLSASSKGDVTTLHTNYLTLVNLSNNAYYRETRKTYSITKDWNRFYSPVSIPAGVNADIAFRSITYDAPLYLERKQIQVEEDILDLGKPTPYTISPADHEARKTPYLWERQMIIFTDGRVELTEPSPVHLAKDGAPGKGIKDTRYRYAKTSAPSPEPTESQWSPEKPEYLKGDYAWTQVIWEYTDGTVENSAPMMSYIAEDGVGISNTLVAYALSTTNVQPADNLFSPEVPDSKPGDYVWTRVTLDYTDPNKTDSKFYTVARVGRDGVDGYTPYEQNGTWWINGQDTGIEVRGENGVGITSYENYYKLTPTTSKPTNTSETGWSNIAPLTTSTDKYLWMYSKIQLSNGEINRTSPAIISMFSESGKSAYDLAKEQGYSGTLNQWIESLKGAKGDDGAIRGTTPPTDLTKLWLDESVTPAKLKFHDGSDWVPFDEEIFLKLDELSEATTTVSSELQTLNDSIMAEVKSVQSDILSNQEVTNSLKLTQDSFTEEFNRVKSGIDANGEYIESLKATITSTVDEDMNPYTEWKSGDNTRVIVGSNAISMDSAGVETFRIENGEAKATSLYVTNEIGFGNHTAKKYGTDFTIFSWTGRN